MNIRDVLRTLNEMEAAAVSHLTMPTREAISKSKNAQRRELSARPIAEKLRMLDTLRERQLAIKAASAKRPAPNQRRRET